MLVLKKDELPIYQGKNQFRVCHVSYFCVAPPKGFALPSVPNLDNRMLRFGGQNGVLIATATRSLNHVDRLF